MLSANHGLVNSWSWLHCQIVSAVSTVSENLVAHYGWRRLKLSQHESDFCGGDTYCIINWGHFHHLSSKITLYKGAPRQGATMQGWQTGRAKSPFMFSSAPLLSAPRFFTVFAEKSILILRGLSSHQFFIVAYNCYPNPSPYNPHRITKNKCFKLNVNHVQHTWSHLGPHVFRVTTLLQPSLL